MLIGNLTRDPELRTAPNGSKVCELGLAINRAWTEPDGQKREETVFLDIAFWGRTAENAAKYLAKGRAVFIEGRLQVDAWKDQQTGQDRQRLKVVGERLQFLGGNGSSAGSAPAADQWDEGPVESNRARGISADGERTIVAPPPSRARAGQPADPGPPGGGGGQAVPTRSRYRGRAA